MKAIDTVPYDRITAAPEHHLNSADLIWIIRYHRVSGARGLVHKHRKLRASGFLAPL
jgi:hypothetical protein